MNDEATTETPAADPEPETNHHLDYSPMPHYQAVAALSNEVLVKLTAIYAIGAMLSEQYPTAIWTEKATQSYDLIEEVYAQALYLVKERIEKLHGDPNFHGENAI